MLIYIDRLVCSGNINLTRLNVHRLIITTIMVAAKFFDDFFYVNQFFGTVGGLKPSEINSLEVELLFLLEFNLYVSKEEYERYYNTLTSLAMQKGLVMVQSAMPQRLPVVELAEPSVSLLILIPITFL